MDFVKNMLSKHHLIGTGLVTGVVYDVCGWEQAALTLGVVLLLGVFFKVGK